MALDAFNSVGGYSVGIPPVQVINSTGTLTAPSAVIGNITIAGSALIAGDTLIAGNLTSQTITGNVIGNVTGNVTGNVSGSIVSPGNNTDVIYNNNGTLFGSQGFTFNNAGNVLTVNGNIIANSLQLGISPNIVSTTNVVVTNTTTDAAGQILTEVVASSVSSLDYTVIATDPVGNNRQTTKLYATVLGTDVGYLEFSTIDVPITSPGVGDFSVVYASGFVQLLVTPLVNNLVNYKIHITSYAE